MGFFSKRKDLEAQLTQKNNEIAALENKINFLQQSLSGKELHLTQKEQELLQVKQKLNLQTANVTKTVSRSSEQKKPTALESELRSWQRSLEAQKQQLTEQERTLFQREQELKRKAAAAVQQERILQDRSQAVSRQEKLLAKKEADLSDDLHFFHLEQEELNNSFQILAQKEQELLQREQALGCKTAAAVQQDRILQDRSHAISRQEEQLAQQVQSIQDDFDFPALAPTFEQSIFSSTLLGNALLHYDYRNNSRLFSALKNEIVLHQERFDLTFLADSETGAKYTVTLNSCTCPDFLYRHQPCKHMYRLAVALGWVSRSREEEITQKEIRFKEIQKNEIKNLNSIKKDLQRYEEDIEQQRDELKSSWSELHEFVDTELDHLNRHKADIDRLIFDTMDAFPYIATALIDYEDTRREMELSEYLRTKPRPAIKAAEEIKKISVAKRELAIRLKISEYKLEVYEAAAPWLKDFDISAQELKEALEYENEKHSDEYDLLKSWLSPEEYQKLSNAEKYQLALDRYRKRQKSNWAVGIEYERYIGYLYETQGFQVYYSGALKGVEDLGRDLIASKNSEVYIIQCKRWSASKTIHEKHVFQLFGSVFDYQLRHSSAKVKGKLITTCALSTLAVQYAEKLNIEFENIPFDPDYPMIKCNISNAGRIYHLPFDQQYDRVVITPASGEFYAATVAEAEERGFTRAKRWRGSGTT